MRKVYFNRLVEKMNLKKFFELFKWFDTSFTDLLESLIPRKVKFLGVNYVIESHVLERHRFRYLFDEIYLKPNQRPRQSLPPEKGGDPPDTSLDTPVDEETPETPDSEVGTPRYDEEEGSYDPPEVTTSYPDDGGPSVTTEPSDLTGRALSGDAKI